MEELAAKFMSLFRGYEKAHGRYQVNGAKENGKVEGRAVTVAKPVGLAAWIEHLTGRGAGVGVIPLTDADTVWWVALDVDVKGIDLKALDERRKRLGVPGVVCRSKSGGAHVYVFFDVDVAAEVARRRAGEWSALLGHGGCEVFPKQSTRAGDGDIGNWINMPYFDVAQTNRWAIVDGEQVSAEHFLAVADESRCMPERVQVRTPGPGRQDDLLFEGPPCLQHIEADGGAPEGTRNEVLYSICVYLRKRFPDDWEDKVERYNLALCVPPLPRRDVETVIKSVGRKQYQYKCSQPPMSSHCQRRACVERRFGVGDTGEGDGGPLLGGLTFYRTAGGEQCEVAFEVGGRRVIMDAGDFISAEIVNKRTFSQIGRVAVQMPQGRWRRVADQLGAAADVVEIPEDVSPQGILWWWVEKFLTQAGHAPTLEEIFSGRPHRASGKVQFRSADLVDFLSKRKVSFGTMPKFYKMLNDHGATKQGQNLGGRFVNVWTLAEPVEVAPPPPGVEPQEEEMPF